MRAVFAALLVASGSAHAVDVTIPPLPENAYEYQPTVVDYDEPRDPFEGLNRLVFRFNFNVMDQYVYRPVTVGWMTVMPGFARTGVSNFIDNLEEPASVINNALQLKFADSGTSVLRFAINSTAGLLGTIDIADKIGMPRREEDFEEVLGHYGTPAGPYMMVPVYGPATPRALAGDVVDSLVPPVSWLTTWESVAKWTLKGIETRAEFMGQEGLLFQSLDPYVFTRQAYFDHVDWQVYDGKVPGAAVDPSVEDYLDEIDF